MEAFAGGMAVLSAARCMAQNGWALSRGVLGSCTAAWTDPELSNEHVLCGAATVNNVALVRRVLRVAPHLAARRVGGCTAMEWAVWYANLEAAEVLAVHTPPPTLAGAIRLRVSHLKAFESGALSYFLNQFEGVRALGAATNRDMLIAASRMEESEEVAALLRDLIPINFYRAVPRVLLDTTMRARRFGNTIAVLQGMEKTMGGYWSFIEPKYVVNMLLMATRYDAPAGVFDAVLRRRDVVELADDIVRVIKFKTRIPGFVYPGAPTLRSVFLTRLLDVLRCIESDTRDRCRIASVGRALDALVEGESAVDGDTAELMRACWSILDVTQVMNDVV